MKLKLALLSAVAASAALGTSALAQQKIKVGNLVDYTGATSSVGKISGPGKVDAFAWINANGGINGKQLEVETPVATAVVRETEFNMKVEPDGQSVLTVVQGVVEFGTAFGTCPIRTNTVSTGVRGKRCTRPAPIDVAPVLSWSRDLLK